MASIDFVDFIFSFESHLDQIVPVIVSPRYSQAIHTQLALWLHVLTAVLLCYTLNFFRAPPNRRVIPIVTGLSISLI